MTTTTLLSVAELRAAFAVRLAALYGREVPAYTTLVEVSREVNERFAAAHPDEAGRLGSLERVTAERHGAIRVGSPTELAQVTRVFSGFGMLPVGFYDLRDASSSSVPVVSTAFRPVEPDELARNPFRVFTSMLVTDDRRFFDADTERRLRDVIGARVLFGGELLDLADRSTAERGLPAADAQRYLDLAAAAFELSTEPVDRDWYVHLERISAVAADIGGVPSTHINHLTPRVLDIDDLYARMSERGIAMIDEIQGPPDWSGPDVLLRQTSFKALAEQRRFRHADGSVTTGSLRVRFGEVEQRGLALTTAGRDVYDRLVVEVDDRLAGAPDGTTLVDVARTVWEENLPHAEAEWARQKLAFFTYHVVPGARMPTSVPTAGPSGEPVSARELLDAGVVRAAPIVYEDFLPRSAAGIFQSNLTDHGTRDDALAGTDYDIHRLSDVMGVEIAEPTALYQAQQDRSVAEAAAALGVAITEDSSRSRERGR